MISATSDLPDLRDVRNAHERISDDIHRTPLLSSRSISERTGLDVRLKCENLQRTGSFKIRGALNALRQIPDELRPAGVVAYSSGNHAQAVALAARMCGMPATIVMPEDSVVSKMEATRAYGAVVISKGVTGANRREIAEEIAGENGATIIPPFDHSHIIAGAGTAILEALEQCPGARTVVVPLGGGGLLAGTALAATSISPEIRVWGVEPAAGDDGRRSFERGEIVSIDPPPTVADGARTTAIGQRNFEIIRKRVEGIVTVDDDELLRELAFAMYRTKLVIEATGALGLTAVLQERIPRIESPVVIILSGGNLDFSLFSRMT